MSEIKGENVRLISPLMSLTGWWAPVVQRYIKEVGSRGSSHEVHLSRHSPPTTLTDLEGRAVSGGKHHWIAPPPHRCLHRCDTTTTSALPCLPSLQRTRWQSPDRAPTPPSLPPMVCSISLPSLPTSLSNPIDLVLGFVHTQKCKGETPLIYSIRSKRI
jgi:hypothetical protein